MLIDRSRLQQMEKQNRMCFTRRPIFRFRSGQINTIFCRWFDMFYIMCTCMYCDTIHRDRFKIDLVDI